MAKPKQSKFSRARVRSRVRRPKKNASRGWLIATLSIVMVGALLVVLTYSDNQAQADVPPLPNKDHWHSYLGVNICGTWQQPVPEFHSQDGAMSGGIQAGIHSHGSDSLIHLHPYASYESGNSATLGKYLEYAQSSVSETSIRLWSVWAPGVDLTNGDKCPDGSKTGEMFWKVGRVGKPWPTKARAGNPSNYKIKNGDIIALYFVPKGTKLEQPPGSNESLASISDLNGQPAIPGPVNPETTTTSGSDTSSTSAATSSSSGAGSSSTTGASGSTSSSSAPTSTSSR